LCGISLASKKLSPPKRRRVKAERKELRAESRESRKTSTHGIPAFAGMTTKRTTNPFLAGC
jgi:hypothetical protein